MVATSGAASPGASVSSTCVRPNSATSAGTSSERTTNESMRTPTASRKASWRNAPEADDGEQGEAQRQRQSGDRDGPSRAGHGGLDGAAQRTGAPLLPDPSHEEDAVVAAQRDEQHGGGERYVVGDVLASQHHLEQVRRDPEGGRERQHAGSQEVEGRDQCAQEDHHEHEVDEGDDEGDAAEVADGAAAPCRRPARCRRRTAPRRRSGLCGRAAPASRRSACCSPRSRRSPAGRCGTRPGSARRRRRGPRRSRRRARPAARAGRGRRPRPADRAGSARAGRRPGPSRCPGAARGPRSERGCPARTRPRRRRRRGAPRTGPEGR